MNHHRLLTTVWAVVWNPQHDIFTQSLDCSYEWDECVTYAGVPALADVSLCLTDAVDLRLVPFSGSLQHIQTGQQRVLLLLQLLHLLQLTEHMWKIWPTSGLIQRSLLKTSIFSIYSFSRCFLSKVRTTKALLGYQAAVWNSCLDVMSLFTIMIYNMSGLVIFSTSLPSLIFRHKWDSGAFTVCPYNTCLDFKVEVNWFQL